MCGPRQSDLAPHQFARKLAQLPIDGLRLLGPEQRLDVGTWFGAATEVRFTALLRYREGARSLVELELGEVVPLVDAIPELKGVGQRVGQARNGGSSNVVPFPNRINVVHEEGLEPKAEAGGRSEGASPGEARPEGVHEEGLEPPHLSVPEHKSGAFGANEREPL